MEKIKNNQSRAKESLDMELSHIFIDWEKFSEEDKTEYRLKLQTIRKKRCKNNKNLLTLPE